MFHKMAWTIIKSTLLFDFHTHFFNLEATSCFILQDYSKVLTMVNLLEYILNFRGEIQCFFFKCFWVLHVNEVDATLDPEHFWEAQKSQAPSFKLNTQPKKTVHVNSVENNLRQENMMRQMLNVMNQFMNLQMDH